MINRNRIKLILGSFAILGCAVKTPPTAPKMMEALANYSSKTIRAEHHDRRPITVVSRIGKQHADAFAAALKHSGAKVVVQSNPAPDEKQLGVKLVLRSIIDSENSAVVVIAIIYDLRNGRVEEVTLKRTGGGWKVVRSVDVGDI